MMWGSTQAILLVVVGVAILQGTHILGSTPYQDRPNHVNFVLLGATGNLAQKYLWQGLYDVFTGIQRVDEPYATLKRSTVAFYGGARAERSSGEEALKDILKNNIQYESVADGDAFAKNVAYVQLKTCEHYETFCRDVLNKVDVTADQTDEDDGYCYEGGDCSTSTSSVELGRVFYLAVTPYSYEELAECIQRVCRPPDSRTWLRLVLEKPYGSDLSSVNTLTSSLLKHYLEEEVYLVDHYLGKVIAKQMLPFRYDNRQWLEPLLNNEFVDRIEIVIKEKEDAEGRLNYYDTYGVFLDILQNHGMEMLTLVAMDLPQNLQDTQSIRQQKERFLKSVSPVNPRNIVAGQYRDYVLHGKMQFKDEAFNSSTATFGSVLLQISNPRWRGVPIFLVSGKALGQKSTYIRAIFKDAEFHLGNIPETSGRIPKELVFTISQSGVGDITGPSIALSINVLMDFPNYAFVGCPFKKIQTSSHIVCLHEGEDKAYSSVVSNVVLGRRDSFVGLQQLTSSWNMWGLAISHLTSGSLALRLYDSGDEDKLKFVRRPFGLTFADDVQSVPEVEKQYFAEFTPQLGGRKTVVKPTLELIETVSHDLLMTAQTSLKDADVFHLAFPGGRTSKTLFHYLTSERLFPWDQVHVWLVDERCVPSNHQQSNFRNLEEQLLAHIWVPHSQVHPMPVDLANGLCDPKDNGSLLYEKWLKRHLNDGGRLEAAVLGVGVDGHIASLFPGGDYLSENDDNNVGSSWVILTKSPPGSGTSTDRMSLSLRFLLQAKKLLVVITGKDKHGIVETLSEETQEDDKYQLPVRLLLGHSDVTLYIDDDAFHG